MSKQWFNSEGEPIEIPSDAVAWQVRRVRTPEPAEVLYGSDGRPLFVPIDAEIEDVRRAVASDGRYYLTPVDEHYRRIAGGVCAWIELPPASAPPPETQGQLSVQHVQALGRTTADVAQLLIAQAAILLDAAGTLLDIRADTDVLATAIRQLVK